MESNDITTLEEVKKEAAAYINKNESSERIQLIIFKLGREEYAMNIAQIKEVVITPRIARVPQTAEYIKGVANIRGNIIAIMDLEERFSLIDTSKQNVDESIANYTLVVESEDYKVGILVKEVPNTLSIRTSDIDSSSDIIRYSALDEKCIRGIVKSSDRMIIMIDMFELLSIDEHVKKITKI
ncbi:MAG TPA: chemotaxis protein CheW [Cytophagaceae bacterium]|jgi:purine-binding chemotaxis protein CheW|nr:chemotaxis protein CheW [Cytophagaceae bacterium]